MPLYAFVNDQIVFKEKLLEFVTGFSQLVLAHLIAVHPGDIEALVPENYYRAVSENLHDNMLITLTRPKQTIYYFRASLGKVIQIPSM